MLLLVLFAYSGFADAAMENYRQEYSLFEATNNVSFSANSLTPEVNSSSSAISRDRSSQNIDWGNIAVEFAAGQSAILLKHFIVSTHAGSEVYDSPFCMLVYIGPDLLINNTVPYCTANFIGGRRVWWKGLLGSIAGEAIGFISFLFMDYINGEFSVEEASERAFLLSGTFSCIGAVIGLNL